MARVPFSEVFVQHLDGSLEPKRQVKIGGVTLAPGVRFGTGVSFSGVNLAQYVGRDLEIEIADGVIVVTRAY